jgi:hypothetical protein
MTEPAAILCIGTPGGRCGARSLDQVRTVMIEDAEGNSVAFARAPDRHVAYLGPVNLRSLFRMELSLPPQRLSRLVVLAAGQRKPSSFSPSGVLTSEGCR